MWGVDGRKTRVLQPLEPYLLKRPNTSGLSGAVAGPGPGSRSVELGKRRALSAVEAIRVGKRTKR